MSGHNRWSKLKRRNAVMGVAKGRVYNKLIKELTVSARLGGGDPENNARLRVAVGLARDANMPADNITRAIKKGTGELEGASYEEVVYEAYGPGGVAMLVECLTDNRNRTASDVRSALMMHGGNLAVVGAVSFMFEKKGTITVTMGPSEDEVMIKALDAGAEDVLNHGEDGFELRTAPNDLHRVASALEQAGVQLVEQKWTYIPATLVKVEDRDKAKAMLKLMELLEENDDVQNVHANFEMDEALMDEVA